MRDLTWLCASPTGTLELIYITTNLPDEKCIEKLAIDGYTVVDKHPKVV